MEDVTPIPARGSGGGGGGGGGSGSGPVARGYVYRTAFTLDDLCRVRDADFDDGYAQFVRAADGGWQLARVPAAAGAQPFTIGDGAQLRGGTPVHFDRLRDGTLQDDTTLEGRGWEDVKPLMGSEIEVGGETYRRYALFRAEAAAWAGVDDWRVVPAPTPRFPSRAMLCPYPPGRDSVDPRLLTVDPASVKLSCKECGEGSERVASACPAALTAGMSRWTFDGVVLLPTPTPILMLWIKGLKVNTRYSPRVTAHALMDSDRAATCAADAVAYYDAAVELSEYDTVEDFAARASADCLTTVWAVLLHQQCAGNCADAQLEANDVLRVLLTIPRHEGEAVVCTDPRP